MTVATVPPLALTMGDPSGIGLDVTLDLWLERARLSLPAFLFIGDGEALLARAAARGLNVAVAAATPETAAAVFNEAIPVHSVPLVEPAIAGKPSSENAGPIIAAIETAVALTMSG